MHFDWSSGALAEGLHRYNSARFWDAHESWEDLWRASPEPEKTFLQGLIQVAAACHHLQRNNRLGAQRLFTHALRRLDPYPPDFGSLQLGHLRADIRDCLNRLAEGIPEASIHPPQITPLDL